MPTDHVRNTLVRQAATARHQRFDLQPLHPEPSTAKMRALEAHIQLLEARNAELMILLHNLTLKD